MAAQQEDYLMRVLEMVGEMLIRITKLRSDGRLEEALSLVIMAEEKLFARPAPSFASLPIDEQLRLLSLDEPMAAARAKRLLYASTLKEAGLIYQARDKDAAATSAFQLALYVMLTVAIEPNAPLDELKPQITQLVGDLPREMLYAPTAELLDKFRSANP